MINESIAKAYCSDDISKIVNYEEAIADTTQTWICHHILGEILTRQQLLDHDFYYNVPHCMLKFVTLAEHVSLHMKGSVPWNKNKTLSNETRKKMSEAKKGKHFSEEHRRKLSESHKNISDETRKKLSESHKGKRPKNLDDLHKSQKGKHLSEETKQKIREAWARRKAAKNKV